MKQITVYLPDDLDARLRLAASLRTMSISQFIREAIEAHLGSGRRRLVAAGSRASGSDDISERIEEILAEEGLPSS